VPDGVSGSLIHTSNARLLNISKGGALIEHMGIARPGRSSQMTIAYGGKQFRLPCAIAWSKIVRAVPRVEGDRELVYQTGVTFREDHPETDQPLEQLLWILRVRTEEKSPVKE
jgi:hypothetical protein